MIIRPAIANAASLLGPAPWTDSLIEKYIHPLFSKALEGDSTRNEIYLANHSLGRPLDFLYDDLLAFADGWAKRMDAAWCDMDWNGSMMAFRRLTAQLLGLPDGNYVTPKNSAGQGLRAILNALWPKAKAPLKVAATRLEFDSADHILKTYREAGLIDIHWIEPDTDATGTPHFSAQSLHRQLPSAFDVLIISQVFFATGQVAPGLEETIHLAHKAGAIVILDTYHSAGVLPIDLIALDADFALGGSYKYLRGGPGAAWLALHPRVAEDESWLPIDTGWFAKKEPFHYERTEVPVFGEKANRWNESTSVVVTAYQALAGLEFTVALGVDQIRKDCLRRLHELREAFAKHKIPFVRQHSAENWGAFALLEADNAAELACALRETGVNVDARGRFVRFCPDLLNTIDQLHEAASRTAHLMRSS